MSSRECRIIDRLESAKQAERVILASQDPNYYQIIVKDVLYCVSIEYLYEKMKTSGFASYVPLDELGIPAALDVDDMQYLSAEVATLLLPVQQWTTDFPPRQIYRVHRHVLTRRGQKRKFQEARPFEEKLESAWLQTIEWQHEKHLNLQILRRYHEDQMTELFSAFVRPSIPCLDISLWLNRKGHCYFNTALTLFFVPQLEHLESNATFWHLVFIRIPNTLVHTKEDLFKLWYLRIELFRLLDQMMEPKRPHECSDILVTWNQWAEGMKESPLIQELRRTGEITTVETTPLKAHSRLFKKGGGQPLFIFQSLAETFNAGLYSLVPFGCVRPYTHHVISWYRLANRKYARQHQPAWNTLLRSWASTYGPLPEFLDFVAGGMVDLKQLQQHVKTLHDAQGAKYGDFHVPLTMNPKPEVGVPTPWVPTLLLDSYVQGLSLSIQFMDGEYHSIAITQCQGTWYMYCDSCPTRMKPARDFLIHMFHMPLRDHHTTETLSQILNYVQMLAFVDDIVYYSTSSDHCLPEVPELTNYFYIVEPTA